MGPGLPNVSPTPNWDDLEDEAGTTDPGMRRPAAVARVSGSDRVVEDVITRDLDRFADATI
jgi:hypothetical protein